MLIPEFKITQDDDFIIVSIRLPYVKVTACEFYIEDKVFKFYLKPYLLNLSFEQSLKTAQEPSKAIYNHDKHILTVYLEKNSKKQYFQNLNLLSSILTNKKQEKKQNKNKQKKVLIEVMDQKGQKVIEGEENEATKNQYGYGFCGNYYHVFKNLEEEVTELFSFDPKDVAINQRYELSKKITYEDFDQNSYMYDKMSNFQEIDRIIESSEVASALIKLVKEYHGSSDLLDSQKFKSQMKIPNKEIIVPKGEHPHIWKQLISIAFCYIYELFCMEGEMGVESARTINKACGVFSCNLLYRDQGLKQVINDSVRRCVTYSLYKHIDICQKIVQILRKQLSVQLLIAIVCELRFMFEKSEPRYLINTIYLNDYCIYLMHGVPSESQKHLAQIQKTLKSLNLSEHDLGLDIEDDNMESMLDNESGFVANENNEVQQTDDLQKLLDLD